MKISGLIERVAVLRVEGDRGVEVAGLHYDSRRVVPGSAFFALRGEVTDGHRFIDDAIARGAVAVFLEEDRPLPVEVVKVLVADARLAMAHAATAFYGDPIAGIPVIGVTGTNGKTTVTYLVESVLRAAGKRPAVLGTIAYRFGQRQLAAPHTTPEAVDLMRIVAEYRQAGADALVMEVSSHALEQRRVEGVRFDVGVFTNLTPEHLDYHGDMPGYFASKRRLFDELLSVSQGRAVVNVDDPYGARLAEALPGALTCGRSAAAVIRARDVVLSMSGAIGRVETPAGLLPLNSPLLGEFNLQNLLCAAGAGLALGIDPATVAAGLAGAPPIPGRLERIENDRGAEVLVDYAHTADALEKALSTLKALAPRRLLVVFGCGGDRDRSKRPAMGEVAARYCDLAVVTSDNPRSEDPLAIIEEVKAGTVRGGLEELPPSALQTAPGRGFAAVCDRRAAIDLAVAALRPGDLLLVAGKGHEDYQIVGRERLPFDDRSELRRALAAGKEG